MRARTLLGVSLLAALVLPPRRWLFAEAACPLQCSGHGTCGGQDICSCFSGYTGFDCAQRFCPVGPAWVGKSRSSADNGIDAHRYAECSNAGTCDRMSGRCVCAPGHAGSACDRVACPSSISTATLMSQSSSASGARRRALAPRYTTCSGHGECVSILDLGRLYGTDSDPSTRGDGTGPLYGDGASNKVWDENVLYGCFCDGGFGDNDCSHSICPKGPNPNTLNQQQRAITFSVDLNSVTVAAGTGQHVYLRFLGSTTDALDIGTLSSLSDAACATWVATHPFVRTAVCRKTVANTDEYALDLRLTWENVQRPHNNFFDHDGNPALASFNCVAKHVTSGSVTCSVADVDVVGAVTYQHNGDTGSAITIEVVDDTAYPNTYKVTVGTTTYATAAMSGSATTVGALVNARITWGALWGHTAGARWTVSASGTLSNPTYDEHAECGGIGRCDPVFGTCSCPTGVSGVACSDLSASESNSVNDASSVSTLTADSLTYGGDMLQLVAKRTANASFNFFSAVEGANNPMFIMSGNGQLRSRTVRADQGVTIPTGGLFVGGGGGTILSGGLRVSGGDGVVSNPTFNVDTLTAHASSASYQNTVLRLSADSASSSTFRFLDIVIDADGASTRATQVLGNGQLEVVTGPLVVSSAEGSHVTGSGGLTVSGGGSTLQAGTLAEVTGATGTAMTVKLPNAGFTGTGLHIQATRAASSAFKFSEVTATGTGQSVLTHSGDGKVTIHRGGADVTGGLTITTGGIVVNSGALSVGAGMDVTSGGATVTAGGLAVTSGGSNLAHDGVADAHKLRATSTALTSSEKVVTIESETRSSVTPDHALLYAASRNSGNVMTERLKLTADGVLSVSNYVVLNAKVPTLAATSGTTTLSTSQCGTLVAAGASSGTGTIVINAPPQAGTESSGCTISVVIAESKRDVQIRNPESIGAIHGTWAYYTGAAFAHGRADSTSFNTNAGSGTAIAIAGTDSGGDGTVVKHARITITAVPQKGAQVWFITDAYGPWTLTGF